MGKRPLFLFVPIATHCILFCYPVTDVLLCKINLHFRQGFCVILSPSHPHKDNYDTHRLFNLRHFKQHLSISADWILFCRFTTI